MDIPAHLERVCRECRIDGHENRLPALVTGALVVALRAHLDARDIAQANHRLAATVHYQAAETLDVVDHGLRVQVELDVVAANLAGGTLHVVASDGLQHIACRQSEGRQEFGIEPHAHREAAPAVDARLAHALGRAQHGHHHPIEVVRDLLQREHLAAERQEHQLVATHSHVLGDDGVLGVERQLAALLCHLGGDVDEGGVDVLSGTQMRGDLRHAVGTARLDIIEAFGRSDCAFQRTGDETLDEIGVGARIGRGYLDDRIGDLGILAQAQAVIGSQPEQHDDQAHHAGEHRPTNEGIGEVHWPSWTLLSMATLVPESSFRVPAVTMMSPSSIPSVMAIRPWRRWPLFT